MSIANNRLSVHRKPKITQLPEGRLQVERWFRIGAEVDTEGNARLTARIFGGYGLLDGTTATDFEKTEFPASAFTDCRLVDENTDEQFTQSGKRFHILYQKYQTLTASWALEDEDKEGSTESGLRTLTRQQVAIAGTAAPYDESDVGVVIGINFDAGTGAFTAGQTLSGGTSVATGTIVEVLGTTAVGTLTLSGVSGTFQDNEAILDDASGSAVLNGKTLYLTGFDDDSNDARGRFITRWAEAGLLAINPIEEGGFSLAQSYIYTSQGLPPSTLHATSALPKPAGGTLAADATFFEPRVSNVNGFPQYTQLVIDAALPDGETEVKVHSKQDFFDVVDPGEMNVGWTFNQGAKAGSAVNFPEAVSDPKRYRKKGTIDVYLTTDSTISETEVAYSDEDVNWASMSFINYYYNDENGSASTSGRWRSFNKFLLSSGILNPVTTFAEELGVYRAESLTYVKGDTTYTTSGIYRVILKEYKKGPDGTQYYLKTIITFA